MRAKSGQNSVVRSRLTLGKWTTPNGRLHMHTEIFSSNYDKSQEWQWDPQKAGIPAKVRRIVPMMNIHTTKLTCLIFSVLFMLTMPMTVLEQLLLSQMILFQFENWYIQLTSPITVCKQVLQLQFHLLNSVFASLQEIFQIQNWHHLLLISQVTLTGSNSLA